MTNLPSPTHSDNFNGLREAFDLPFKILHAVIGSLMGQIDRQMTNPPSPTRKKRGRPTRKERKPWEVAALDHLLKDPSLTKRELARLTGVHESTISRSLRIRNLRKAQREEAKRRLPKGLVMESGRIEAWKDQD